MSLKFSIVLFLFCSYSFSQVKLEGIVSDSLKTPLQSASVVAINSSTNGLESYGLTDETGKYKLNLKTNSSYKIQVSSIGLITINESLETEEANIERNYALRADIVLDEVVVKMPIVVSNVLYNFQGISRLFIREAVCACREVSGTCEFGAKLIVDMLLQVSYCSTTFSQSLMDELMKQYNQVNSGELKNLSTLMLEILVSQFY